MLSTEPQSHMRLGFCWMGMFILSDKITQIKVLFDGRERAYDYACQTLDVDNMMDHSYADVFTVSEAEVDQYIY